MPKINKRYLYLLFSFFVFLEPQFFSTIKPLHYLFVMAKLMIIFYNFLSMIRSKSYKPTPAAACLLLFFTYYIIRTLFSRTPSASQLVTMVEYFGLVLVIDIEIRHNAKQTMNALFVVSAGLLFLNFCCMILFPKGLYKTQSQWENDYVYWLIGYKNPISRFAVSTLGIFLCDCQINKKSKIETAMVLAVSIGTVFLAKSATGIVAMAVLLALYYFGRGLEYPKILNIPNIFLMGAVITWLIYSFHIQEYFSYIIVNILHRSLTLTSRTSIWTKAVEAIGKSPVFGYGFNNAETAREIIGATHPHNFYFYLLFCGGIVGVLLFFISLVAISRKAEPYRKTSIYQVCTAVFATMIVCGLAESLTNTHLFYALLPIMAHLAEINRYSGLNKEFIFYILKK